MKFAPLRWPRSPLRSPHRPYADHHAEPATAEKAKEFVDQAADKFRDQLIRQARAEWVYSTYITEDTEALNAEQEAILTKMLVSNAAAAAGHAKAAGLDYDTDRILSRMRTVITTPAPSRDGAAVEVATLKGRLQGIYGKGKGTLRGEPINGNDIEAKWGPTATPKS